jgi:subfamily B ATP-binding cassette protein HlyB/CyaB
MNAPPEPYSVTPSREMSGQGLIEIKNIAFRYSEELP